MLPEPITKLIIAEDQAEDAEQIISVLRNSGIALRPQRISTEEELAASLESFTPDLVLANPGCKDITLAAIGRALDATGKDVALLALTDKLTDDVVAGILADGNVRGIALRNRHDQLQAVVRREPAATCAGWKRACANRNAAAIRCWIPRAIRSPTSTKAPTSAPTTRTLRCSASRVSRTSRG